MTDTGSGAFSLHPAWHALATRLAVAAATLVAIVSLTQHTPIWVASLRGALTFVAARLVARWGLAALTVALRADRERESEENAEES